MTCPLCSSKKQSTIFTSTNFHGRHQYNREKIPILKCLKCGCIFPSIKIDSTFYQKYYPKHYRLKSNFLEKFWLYLNLTYKKSLLPHHCRLLDVGCGRGEFLKSLPAYIKATGIDFNSPKIKTLSLINDDFLTHKFNQKFDVITFWHSLEHFSNPRKAISKALSLLKTKGQIIITIPNTNSLAFKFGQKSWFHLDPPRHLFIPDNQNIKQLFSKKFKLKIAYLPFEFPLDLFWSLKKYPLLRLIYPLLKVFDRETMLIIVSA